MLDKKAQAAMEYLMSYGWAIIAVIIAIASLTYFGVFKTDGLQSQGCFLPQGIACTDFRSGSDGVSLLIENSVGDGFIIESINLSAYNNCIATFFTKLDNGDKGRFDIPCNLSGNKLNSDLILIYESKDGLRHIAIGKLIADIEKNTIGIVTEQSDMQVCQDAQNNGLCSGLDLVYGSGYQAACCGEHNLCC